MCKQMIDIKQILVLESITWNYLTVCRQITSGSFKNKLFAYKQDLALNNPQGLIGHKIQPNQTKPDQYTKIVFSFFSLQFLGSTSLQWYCVLRDTIISSLWPSELSVCQWSGWPGFNPRSCYSKDFKNGTWYLFA